MSGWRAAGNSDTDGRIIQKVKETVIGSKQIPGKKGEGCASEDLTDVGFSPEVDQICRERWSGERSC